MADRSSLLNQLRIDRSEPVVRRSAPLWWTLAAAIAIGGAGFIAWYFSRSAAVPIRTAVAISLRNESASQVVTSLLDASGYVVARRRATVASKITGKVIEVSMEEGQRVRGAGEAGRGNRGSGANGLRRRRANFRRNERQKAAGVISAQSFDQAKTQFDAAISELIARAPYVAGKPPSC